MGRVPLKIKIRDKISRSRKRNVFTRKDFIAFGGYDQIGRALLNLTNEGKLIRVGYGLYVKARKNRITGLPMIAADGGFYQVAKEALDLLGVEWKPSTKEQNYNSGSTQIPINPQAIIKSRFKRKIATEKFRLQIA